MNKRFYKVVDYIHRKIDLIFGLHKDLRVFKHTITGKKITWEERNNE